jgi:hypothetical protein
MIDLGRKPINALLALSSLLLINTCEEAADIKEEPPLSNYPEGWTSTWGDGLGHPIGAQPFLGIMI